jgi:BlaI family penicillinase repressor
LGLPIGYTTVQTRLNRLVKKKIVAKSKTRPATYSALVTQDQVRSVDLDILVERVSEGRITPLVAQLMSRKGVTREEIEEIKSLLAAAEKNTRQKGKQRG